MLSIGLMSGTSMDGIDAALLRTDGSAAILEELGHVSMTYEAPFKILLKGAEYAVRMAEGSLEKAEVIFQKALKDYVKNTYQVSQGELESKLRELSQYLKTEEPPTLKGVIQHSTTLHAVAIRDLLKKTGFTAEAIDVVGYHGQTFFHKPSQKISIIVGDGQALAEATGITVVNDFRSRDIALGGQGAPFAPLYHHALAKRDKKIPLAVVNCGGIANITLINSEDEIDLIGFDTGPGNGLVDRLVRQRTQGVEHMDRDGQYGQRGRVNTKVLEALYDKSLLIQNKNYFSLLPPKSLDIGDLQLIPELEALSLEDACTTLEAFTADSIVKSLDLLNVPIPTHWVLAGGGWYNPVIRRELENRLGVKEKVKVFMAEALGWNTQAMEAQIFAFLAVRSLQNKPTSLPNTTQVTGPVAGGQAHLPSRGATLIVQQLIAKNPAILTGYRDASGAY